MQSIENVEMLDFAIPAPRLLSLIAKSELAA